MPQNVTLIDNTDTEIYMWKINRNNDTKCVGQHPTF